MTHASQAVPSHETPSPTTRPPSDIDGIADRYTDAYCELDPLAATYLGVPGHDTELPDYSPAGIAARADLDRAVLRDLAAARPADDVDRVTVAAMQERIGTTLELIDAGLLTGDLNVIASPMQEMRQIFDLMPTETEEHWRTISARLKGLPEAVDGYVEALREAVAKGHLAAIRQIKACADQCDDFAGNNGFFAELVGNARPDGGEPGSALAADLAKGAEAARSAYARLGTVLREELAEQARQDDAVGREAYQLWSRFFLGATVDLDETYAWGREELARIVAEQERVADAIKPGSSIDAAIEVLNSDPARMLHGTDALKAWMQQLSDTAVADLADTHFDIPEPIRRLECLIAPTTQGGIYYTGPTDDFSRPGRMWWAVPEGTTEFVTWRETTTVYHEGVPGHHLQIAQTMYRKQLLNRWRRLLCWCSGHGEGWALYAERLMSDLGYLDDPGDRLGMLDAQRMRAARVVLDIGVHLGLPAPEELGGGTWNAENAWPFLTSNSRMSEGFLRFELDRYLGWPGQAPSYKIGERLWLGLRDELQARDGDAFDLKSFHRQALDIGGVGLDVLRGALLG